MQLLVDLTAGAETIRAKWTPEGIRSFITQAIDGTGLTPFGELQEGADPKTDLIVAIQGIAQSHIAVHLRRALKDGFVDVFSCEDFDAPQMIGLVAACFCGGPTDTLKPRLLDRGHLP